MFSFPASIFLGIQQVVMSRELQDKADVVMKELKEMLVPISSEIKMRKYHEYDSRVLMKSTGKME